MNKVLKIAKWGNAAGIRIPALFLEMLRLGIGDEIKISEDSGRIIIEPYKSKKYKTLAERLEEYSGPSYREVYEEDLKILNSRNSVGKEELY